MLGVLSGPGGMGKTALALQWAHSVHDRFTGGQLYVDLAGFSGTTPVLPGEALGMFLRSLGVSPQRVPVELAEQASLYRSLLAGRSVLVVLDNAYSAGQVRTLIPSSPGCAALVTSRTRLTGLVADGARLLDVGPLGMTSAVRLLAKSVGDDRVAQEDAPARTLVGMCGGLPIAVRVAAARLVARPRWPVRRVVAELSDEQVRLAQLSRKAELSVQTTFDLSYRTLSDTTAVLYRRLALHPGREFGPELASSLLDNDAEAVLEELVEASLVEEIGEDRYRFHDLLRLHAREKAGTDDAPEDQQLAQRRMLEWYLAAAAIADMVVTPHRRRLPYAFIAEPAELPVFDARQDALDWLDRERVNLIGAGQIALSQGWAELAWHLCDVMWPLLLHRKHYNDRVGIDERGVAAARRWGNAFAEADMLKRLGRVSATLKRFDDADRYLRASIERASSIDDRRGIADAREALGLLYLDLGRPEEALAEFEALVEENRVLHADRSLGLTLVNLGKTYTALGRVDEAARSLADAATTFDGLDTPDPYNKARVSLADAHVQLLAGEVDHASDTGEQVLDLMGSLGSGQGMAEAHEVLAEVADRRGNTTLAIEHLEQSLNLLTHLGSSRATSVRNRLQALANALARDGNEA
ncbi:ATP-binding protein [Umezawaea tangerina]|uniref:ATP/maltotriose-dependent transcriptional regulator MalT n=1 Tax=Umezawaea tangerina TaxID=84725 RepID=A0A2T0SSI7_9PSEU|nr:ATP/maltotriose-dependent transcriptional regulator MalT [Umezawaea tangerina]